MPVLPLIDLLILLGWTSLSIGAVLKVIYVSTSYRPTFVGLAPFDLLLVAGCALLFAVALAARTWVKAHEPGVLAARRRLARQPEEPMPGFANPADVRMEMAHDDARDEGFAPIGRRQAGS